MGAGALLRIRRFDAGYVEQVALADETQIVLRSLGPGDDVRIAGLFGRLSPRSRRQRFLYGKSTLTGNELHALSDLDGEQRFAIAACLSAPGGLLIGIVRLAVYEGQPEVAEVAISIADELQRHGLGRLLLRRIFAAARERGVKTVHLDVLDENAAMLGLIRAEAPSAHRSLPSLGVVAVDVALPAAPN